VHTNSQHWWHTIRTLEHQGQVLVEEEQKTLVIYDFFNDILGVPADRASSLHLELLDLSRAELGALGEHFTESEILSVTWSLPPDKAPGPDGFKGRFFQATWEIIRGDILAAFDDFWHMGMRNFSSINDALLMLIPK
jgi:hypothetical protein